MAKRLTELSVDITGDASGLSAALAKASSDVARAGQKIIADSSSIQKAIAGIGAGVSLGGFAAAVKGAIDYGDELRDTSRAIGATVEQLSFLDFAARQSGSNMDELAGAVSRMQRNLGEIAAGRGEQARQAFERLKLDPKQLFRDDLITQIQKVGDALNGVKNQSERSALGQAALGKGFRAVASLAREGADGIQAMADRFVELNGVVTGDAADQFDGVNDSIGEMRVAWQSLARVIAVEVSPALTQFFKFMADAAPSVSTVFGNLGSFIAAQFAEVPRAIAKADLAVAEFLQKTVGKIGIDQTAKVEDAKRRLREANSIIEEAQLDAARRAKEVEERQKKLREALKQQAPAADVDINETAAQRAKRAAEEAKKARDAERERKQALQESAEVENYLSDVVRERAKAFDQAQQKIRADAQAVYDATRTPLEAYTIEVQRLLALPLEDDTLQRGIAKARDELERAGGQAKKTKSAMAELGATFSSAFEDAIVEGKKFSDVLAGIAQDIARLLIRKNITDPIAEAISSIGKGDSGGGGGGGFDLSSIGDLFSKGWGALKSFLPGFQYGGSFQVGGTGGTDSQLVAFRATPGEQVTIGQPTEGGGQVSVAFQIQANDAAGFDTLLMKRRGMIVGMMQSAFDKSAKKGLRR